MKTTATTAAISTKQFNSPEDLVKEKRMNHTTPALSLQHRPFSTIYLLAPLRL